MATENILMAAVKRGGDRQELHEAIRGHSMDAARQVKEYGQKNDLLDRIAGDPLFGLTKADIEAVLSPENYTGRCAGQVEEFIRDVVNPALEGIAPVAGTSELRV